MKTEVVHPLLVQLYGEEAGTALLGDFAALVDRYADRLPPPGAARLDESDAVLITYADQVQAAGTPPLRALADFCNAHCAGLLSTIHILPFYPWSSDDGFSVIDYCQVDRRYGDWEDVKSLSNRFRLMYDAVINHVSVKSSWFEGMLRGDERYREYFVTPPADADLTKVVRPRALPLLTAFQTVDGETNIWTTFSADQADLNYRNPAVLLEIVDLLLYYVSQGAQLIRLDAIAYLWKEPGTTSIHLPQTHWIIQLFRAVLDEAAPHVMLITETNVPHAENVSYFGDGGNEAQMVYNFSLPPLVLHAFQSGSAETLTRWATGLESPGERATFFNFLASHDGIGLNPARGILSEAEIEKVVRAIQERGGSVSFKSTSAGETPYELNVNYFDALNDPRSNESDQIRIDRFIAAHAILLSLRGVPAIYFHSLFGSRGWPAGAAETGRARTINRQKLQRATLEQELADPTSLRARIFGRLARLLRARAAHAAFDPYGRQQVIDAGPGVFGLLRGLDDGGAVICLHNVSNEIRGAKLDVQAIPALRDFEHGLVDLISGGGVVIAREGLVELQPYQSLWLVKP